MNLKHKIAAGLAALATAPASAWAALEYNMRYGVTPVSQQMYHLHMTIFWICVVIAVLVFSVMFYSLLKHRKSRGHEAAQFHESTKVEILWTVIPFAILIAMAIPATQVVFNMFNTKDSALTIKATGFQWKWKYDYLNENLSFISTLSTPEDELNNLMPKNKNYLQETDNHLVLPVDTKIRFVFTSNDVIHSWWMPDLGIKKDAIPGYINESWAIIQKPGIYRGRCAELCGINHGYMPIVVEAKSKEDYQAWLAGKKAAIAEETALAAKKWTLAELKERGEKVYGTVCAACHQPNGKGLPPTFPSLVDSPIVKNDINKHLDVVLFGRKGTAMQGFGSQLSETDIAAVITYERNAWGRSSGDMLQPIDVKHHKDNNK